jgi:hypothetical protein
VRRVRKFLFAGVYALDPFLFSSTCYRCLSKPLALSPSPSQHNDNASLSSSMREKQPHRRREETSTFRPYSSRSPDLGFAAPVVCDLALRPCAPMSLPTSEGATE